MAKPCPVDLDEMELKINVQERQWYAVYTAPRHENRITQQLECKSVNCFLPLYESVRHWKTGPTLVALPLFPNYLFVHINAQERRRVLEVPSIVSILGDRSCALPVRDAEIEQLRKSLRTGQVEPHPYLKLGEQVRVTRGPLTGTQGILIKKKGMMKIVLSIDAIMRSVAVEVSSADVEPMQHKGRTSGANLCSN